MNITKKSFSLILLTSIIVLGAIFVPPTAKAAIGDRLVLPQASDITVKFLSSNSGGNNAYGIFSPIFKNLGYGHSTTIGTQFDLGKLPAGELIFFIEHGTNTWETGPASRNVDNFAHANVSVVSANEWRISFEDYYGGGDKDYNDVILLVFANDPAAPAIVCSTNADCGADISIGSPVCQGNNVSQNVTTYTCNNPGTVNSSCSSSITPKYNNCTSKNQTCNNGSCVDQNTSALMVYCSANPASISTTQSTTFIASVTGGTGSYAYSWSGACSGTGSTCSNIFNNQGTQTASVVVTSGTQTAAANCSVSVAQTCTQNYQQRCLGNSLYWYDSCGAQGSYISSCGNNNYNVCNQNSYQRCSGNYLYWYDSCGNQQNNNYQYCANGCSGNVCNSVSTCTQNYQERCLGNSLYWYDSCGNLGNFVQTCQNGCYGNVCQNNIPANLSVTETVKDLTTGTGFANSTYANPSDMLMFMITLQSTGNQDIQNVFVRDMLPANLIYNNQLIVACTGNNNCNNNTGSIVNGISLYTIYAGQTVTITYQAQVAPTQSFSSGSTTLNDSVNVTGSQLAYTPTTSAAVVVTKGSVLGASTVSTGLTNNFWMDSFFLPLLITLILIWMWRSGIFFGAEKWLSNKKTERELYKRIAKIQKTEKI